MTIDTKTPNHIDARYAVAARLELSISSPRDVTTDDDR